MVFVRKSAGRSGATKVQTAERRGGRNQIVEHVGTARSEAELAVLMAQARRRLRPGQDVLDLAVEDSQDVDRLGGITGKFSAVLWQVLTGAYTRLGFDAVGDEAFRQLVLARVVEPTSKADSVRVLEEIGIPHASLRTMFRSLARCIERDYRAQVATACFEHAAASGDLSLVLYDVTTLYFEAEHEDELRKVGFSKERRVDPRSWSGYWSTGPGSRWRSAATRATRPRHHDCPDREAVPGPARPGGHGGRRRRRDAVRDQLEGLHEAGLRVIVGSRATKAPADLASHFRWHGDAFTNGQVIDTITPRVATAAARSDNDTNQRAEPVWDPAAHDRSWRAVWAYSRKRAVRDDKTLTMQENRARQVVDGERPPAHPGS